ncbi:MAG: tRNA (adenosine(37)-N6)-threonylcarbamoyltransferase complex ATPase subunit type 1 TsaE [Nitrospirota bacterium]|nr:MAG: tRNA (adenosine(37)-N6)-threonylcarbamoyltransferase complex ATPase subunit type 1 TsaE [Nitrospirota bacterium]
MLLSSSGAEETIKIGRRIGAALRAGDTVYLYGDIGAGKTTLIKGIASSFGIDERDITSASFTMIAEYDTDPPFYHVDLYRLEGGADIDNIGLYDYIDGNGITVIEWAERLDRVNGDKISVSIEIKGENDRDLEIRGISEEDRNNM